MQFAPFIARMHVVVNRSAELSGSAYARLELMNGLQRLGLGSAHERASPFDACRPECSRPPLESGASRARNGSEWGQNRLLRLRAQRAQDVSRSTRSRVFIQGKVAAKLLRSVQLRARQRATARRTNAHARLLRFCAMSRNPRSIRAGTPISCL